ncbi:GGDEF domain-containing protein [Stutzerimonas stutzeri]|uniref:GGDEF domain-containing protein n=1 Tax=Pseudomonas azerbaijanorientalis TaxID=2842350 RepID=UPI000F74DEB8|nr:diguanylate cyclase [Pseudomonas azerbaijanorientalis]AZO82434.1 GGDEF domain-containing protein [Stutzerimonas stutzeri]AZO90653.1 GGDEF domain-containing protein [Stutzerimonas stutzeri]QXH64150.1 diguanylate cyclase [Pseudomonas azerbaijanorientalis]
MSNFIATDEPPEAVRLMVKVYACLLLAGFALVPAYLIGYLYFFQDSTLLFENHLFHIIAITAATLAGLFVTYVTWRCYQSSGEPLLRWMTLGFLGFVVIYALHGAFTGLAHHNIWLFLLYGPASRLVMSVLLLVAMLSYHRPPDAADQRMTARPWLTWIGLFLLVDVAVAYVANSPIAGNLAVRLSMEGGALVLSILTVTILLLRRIRSPLMTIFIISVTAFALSSLAFILARPWNHMWWLAHAIFAGGFFMLSYGVVQAFLTTRSFSRIYSQEELMVRLAEAMAYAENALQELQRTNQELGHLAATDPLTGADNRRRFMERVEGEIGRTKRGDAPFSVLALDLDNFKSINDRFGHQVGDDILKSFVEKCLDSIRPYDGVARVGGEEFMILLPQTSLEGAHEIAERLRSTVANSSFHGLQRSTVVTVSIGVSQSGRDGDTIEAILRTADQRLYHAKHQGRNRVVTAFKTSLQPLP